MAEHEIVYSIDEIQDILMHRYPFLLVDRVVEFIDGDRIVGLKNVSINEPFFQGHFPGRPVMPGVLIMEAMAQTAAILAKESTNGCAEGKAILLVGADNFKWKKMVVPGDTLRIEMIFRKKKASLWIIDGEVTVEGRMAAKGTISAIEVD